MRKPCLAAVGVLAAVAGAATPALAAPSAMATRNAVTVKVLAKLNSPKHILYANGGVYVAVSGTGGSACAAGPATEGSGTAQYCSGPTGAVERIVGRHATPVLTKLASEISGGEALGPAAVTVDAKGAISVLYQDALVQSNGTSGLQAPARSVFGTFQIGKGVVANLAAFAAAHPQTGDFGGLPGETAYDSDPFDVVADRHGYLVADAAANSLLSVSAGGKVRLITRFPTDSEPAPSFLGLPATITSIDAQAVPTSIAVGPDGAIYVGELRGVPSQVGHAFIYRITGGKATVWASGLSAVTAIAFDAKGRLLATELSSGGLLGVGSAPGALVRISANGRTVTDLSSKLGVALSEPTGVAIAPDGTIYVANNGTSAANATTPGEVLAITGIR